MGITKNDIDSAYASYKGKYGGLREDYFALLHLAKEFRVKPEDIAHQVAFGGNDYGFDAFHVDVARRNLYLYQFKWSTNHTQFKGSLRRLIEDGMARVFGNPLQDNHQNQVLLQLKSALHENQAIIDRVLIHFVFNGDPSAAEQSEVLDSLREDLEAKKYLIDQYFEGRETTLTVQYVSNETRKLHQGHLKKTHRYDLSLGAHIESQSDEGVFLHVGFVPLLELHEMHVEMGHRLFERNIRAGLSEDRPVNRALRSALKEVLDGKVSPHDFVFNHNGVTLFATHLEMNGDRATITEPRVLNGAQTITSIGKFIELNAGNKSLRTATESLGRIRVLAKIISRAPSSFVTAVTINNNRQNPVEAVNLRASDPIQLELQERFRVELGIYYERQDNAFSRLTDDDLEDLGIGQHKALQIRKLGQTFLAAQGEVDRMSRLSEIFEAESTYRACFADRYLETDPRRIVLAYKVHFRLNRLAQEVVEKGGTSYEYVHRAKNLLWALLVQGLLNSAKLNRWLADFGQALTMEADFTEALKGIASTKVRLVFKDAVADERYQILLRDEKYSFLRTKAMYQRCMDIAGERYGWKKLAL